MKKFQQHFSASYALIFIFMLLLTGRAVAQVPFLVKDIDTGPPSGLGYLIGDLNNKLYFSAAQTDTVAGTWTVGMWATDGTNTGSQPIKIGLNSMGCKGVQYNNSLIFGADDGIHGHELWKTDGTPQGTVMIKDLYPEYNSDNDLGCSGNGSSHSGIVLLKKINGNLFFINRNFTGHGYSLWKTDGTENGTICLAGFLAHYWVNNFELVDFNGTLFFVGATYDPYARRELWKSDGTVNGTVFVKYFDSGNRYDYPQYLTVLNNILYFAANDGTNGRELWRSDGTNVGTYVVKDINLGVNGSNPTDLIVFNDKLYFSADDGIYGRELWKTDGTNAGTFLVKDVNQGISNSMKLDADPFPRVVRNQLLFWANDSINGTELWATDGSNIGTTLLKDINPGNGGSACSIPSFRRQNILIGDSLFFAADDGVNGLELWLTDGTNAGTKMVGNISPTNSSNPVDFHYCDHTLYFNAKNEDYGIELWKLDLSGATSAPEPLQKSHFSVYPNPSHSLVNVKGDFSPNTNLILYNNVGEKVLSETITKFSDNFSIDISAFPTGIYFLNISNEKENVSYKVVKN